MGDAQIPGILQVVPQLLEVTLLKRDVERARPLEVAVDAVRGEEAQHLLEVLLAEDRQVLRLGSSEVGDHEAVGVVDALADHSRIAAAGARRAAAMTGLAVRVNGTGAAP